jgi:hypothetical protein
MLDAFGSPTATPFNTGLIEVEEGTRRALESRG